MANKGIAGETVMSLRIETMCKRPAIVCSPDMEVTDAARLMEEHDVTAIVVGGDGPPLGVFSIRDLRRFMADCGGAVPGGKLRDNMGRVPNTVGLKDYVFEAVLKMTRHNLFHLGVVGEEGNIVGIVDATELLQLQSSTPLYLYQEIEQAESIEQLRGLGQRIVDQVRFALTAQIQIESIVRLISGFNDAITLRLIALLANDEGIRLPAGAAYLVLGSEGRGEQTLRTDQDNAIIWADDLPSEQLSEVIRFADRLVQALESIGVPRCPGNIMASSPQWRHSLTEWNTLVRQWIGAPIPEHVLSFGMLQDLRPLHGDHALGLQLRDQIRATAQRSGTFFSNMAYHVVRFPSPFNIFGRIRVEPSGQYRGKVDLKKSGLFAITAGATLLALEAGIVGGNTWDKLRQLRKLRVITGRDLEVIEAAFNHLIRLRLQRQLQEQLADREAANHVDPETMTDKERYQFRQALEGVSTFLWIFRDHYNLDYVSI